MAKDAPTFPPENDDGDPSSPQAGSSSSGGDTDDIDAQIAAMGPDEDEADELEIGRTLLDEAVAAQRAASGRDGAAVDVESVAEADALADVDASDRDNGQAVAETASESPEAALVDGQAAAMASPPGEGAADTAADQETAAGQPSQGDRTSVTDVAVDEALAVAATDEDASGADEPAAEEALDSALKAEIHREVDAAFADEASEVAASDGEAAAGSDASDDDDIRRKIADMGMDLDRPTDAAQESSQVVPETAESVAGSAAAEAAVEGDDDVDARIAAMGITFGEDDDPGAASAAPGAADLVDTGTAESQEALPPGEPPPAVAADGEPGDWPREAAADQAEGPSSDPREPSSADEGDRTMASDGSGDAVAEGERAALMEPDAEAAGSQEGSREAAGGDAASEFDEWPAWVGGLLLLPLRALAAILALANLPFRWVDDDTRDIIGKMAIAALVMSLLALLLALLWPLIPTL